MCHPGLAQALCELAALFLREPELAEIHLGGEGEGGGARVVERGGGAGEAADESEVGVRRGCRDVVGVEERSHGGRAEAAAARPGARKTVRIHMPGAPTRRDRASGSRGGAGRVFRSAAG